MKVLELYSGIGGMHYALLESYVEGNVVSSVDINTVANKVYRHNFKETSNNSQNIQSYSAKDISKLGIDCILMSPPCQPFTRVGLKRDSDDNRCSSLLHLLKVIPEVNSLKYILLENVQGFENSQARDEVISCLRESNFNYKEMLISPCQFGIPNSRKRYYLIAKKKGLNFIFKDSNLITSLPDKIIEILPTKTTEDFLERMNPPDPPVCYEIKNILEENVDERHFIPIKDLRKRVKVMDIRTPQSRRTCCFTKAYTRYTEGTGSVFSPLTDLEIKTIIDKYGCTEVSEKLKNELLSNLKLRYFTPKEVSRLMCFPKNFSFPEDISDKQKYKLLGNSINVFVVSQLIYLLAYENELHL